MVFNQHFRESEKVQKVKRREKKENLSLSEVGFWSGCAGRTQGSREEKSSSVKGSLSSCLVSSN